MLNITEGKKLRERQAQFQAAVDYKIRWQQELELRRQKGISGPDPLPHPDHVILDFDTGTVRIKGPMTKKEKVEWDRLVRTVKGWELKVAEIKKMLASPKCAGREEFEREFARADETVAKIKAVVPPAQTGEHVDLLGRRFEVGDLDDRRTDKVLVSRVRIDPEDG